MLRHIRWDEVEAEKLNPLLERRFVSGEHMTMARFRLQQGCLIPQHSHHNEQFTFVVEGALKLIFPEREVVVRTGEICCIPPHLPHAAEAVEDCNVIDVFSPPRADWTARDDAYLRTPQK